MSSNTWARAAEHAAKRIMLRVKNLSSAGMQDYTKTCPQSTMAG